MPREAALPQPPEPKPEPDDPPPAQAEKAKKGSMLGGSGAPKPATVPKPDSARIEKRADATGAAIVDLKDVLAAPKDYLERSVLLNGAFKIGTQISEVKGSNGQVMGWSIAVARNDGAMVCGSDGKVADHNLFMLLDDRLARFADLVFGTLSVKGVQKPTYQCALTIKPRRLDPNRGFAAVLSIMSLEILGWCHCPKIARREYQQAFRTVTILGDESFIGFADGASWVERLGGEERFVQPLRRKYREMQRRASGDLDLATFDAAFQNEIAGTRAMAGVMWNIRTVDRASRMQITP